LTVHLYMYMYISVEYEVLLTLAVHSEILATRLDEPWTFSVGLKYKILSMVGLTSYFLHKSSSVHACIQFIGIKLFGCIQKHLITHSETHDDPFRNM